MSLIARKIKRYLEDHSVACKDAMNRKLGTEFELDVDWDCLGKVDTWNWQEEDVKKCFYNSYFLLVEFGLEKLFEDDMYKEAIVEQVKTIRLEPGRSVPDYSYAEGVLTIAHSMSPNNGGERHVTDVERYAKNLIGTVESQLS